MNLEQVAHYIAHPHELGLAEAPALKSMSEKHPYASVFSLLYLTALANGKSVDLDDALQQHAYRLSDRTKLYYLLNGDNEVVVSDAVSAVEEDAPASPFGGGRESTAFEDGGQPWQKAEADGTGRTEPETPAINTESKENSTKEEDIVLETVPERTEEIITEILPLSPPPKGETEDAPSVVDFDRITEAFTREQHFEVAPQQEEASTKETETAATEENFTSSLEGRASTAREVRRVAEPINVESTTPEEIITEKETVVGVTPQEIEDDNNQQILPLDPPPKGEAEQTSQPTEQKRSFTSWLKSTASPLEGGPRGVATSEGISEAADNQTPKRSFNDIIESFIKEEPTISRGKTEFFSPSRKAKESLDEEAVPVSETLAKIFAAQGNYPKAIHVYHQLMLSFPEKKSFFAVQIEALKKKTTS